MLVALGRKRPPSPDDLAGLLLACHERIRSFVRLAGELGAAAGAPPAGARDPAGRARRYFAEALPLHVADEEASVLPRLRGRAPELDAALERMRSEHAGHEADVARLVALCAAVEARPGRLAELGPELGRVAARLGASFEEHLEAEERVILPAIAAHLTADERAAAVAELRARRSRPA